MALTDIFTGGGTARAAQAGRQYLTDQQQQLQQLLYGGLGQGIEALRSGQYGAQGALDQYLQPYLESAIGAQQGGAANALQALQNAGGNVRSMLEGNALPKALGALYGGATQAEGTLQPGLQQAAQGSKLYADIMGLNGPEAANAAMANFKAGPAYNFNLNQGLEAINRRAAASGQLVGGNPDRAAQEYGSGLASNEFGGWRQQLAGYNPLEQQYRTSIAGLQSGTGQRAADIYGNTYGALANYFGGQGNQAAGILGGSGNTLADLISRTGMAGAQLGSNIPMSAAKSIADLIGQTGGQYAGSVVGLSKNYTDLLGQAGKASDQGSQNIWNLIGGLFGLGSKSAGGGFGGSPVGSALGYGGQPPIFTFGG